MFDHNKLRGKIREMYGSEIKFAKALKISQSTLSAKLNNKIDFSRNDIVNMQKLLKIKNEDFYDTFFFGKIVCKSQT